MSIRVLQIVKTLSGAKWALDQVNELLAHGIEVHVALPPADGIFKDEWHESGAHIHRMKIELPVQHPWKFRGMARNIRALIDRVAPDIIHSHFFSPTLAMRYALGREHPIPRIFQVPGPSHMEHQLFRKWELSSAGKYDFWIPSSRYTRDLYLNSGTPEHRLYLSYYGNRHHEFPGKSPSLRERYGIPEDGRLVGNINYLYAPRWYLGQTKGIKRHEDVIDALAIVLRRSENVFGLLIGGQWGGGKHYERKIRSRATRAGQDRIVMAGWIPSDEAKSAWVDFDVAVHVPTSENCGGVVEPFMAGVPVIAAHTGGLPEVVLDGVTGTLVPPRQPVKLAAAIEDVLAHLPKHQAMAQRGRELVQHMFDVKRTAAEVAAIYANILDSSSPMPEMFDSRRYTMGL